MIFFGKCFKFLNNRSGISAFHLNFIYSFFFFQFPILWYVGDEFSVERYV